MIQELHNIARRNAAMVASQIGQNRWGQVTSTRQTDTGYEAKVTIQPEGMITEWLPILTPMAGGGWGIVAPPVAGMQAFVMPDCGDGQQGVIAGLTYSTQTMPPQPGGAPVTPGQFALVHKNGSYLLFNDDDVVLVTNRDLLATVGRDLKGTVARDLDMAVHQNATLAVSQNATLDVAQDCTIAIGGTLTLSARKMNATGTDAGSSIVLNAGTVVVNGEFVTTGNISDLSGAHGTLQLLRSDYNVHQHANSGPPTPQDP